MSNKSGVRLSIIIPTQNRAKLLQGTLESIKNQTLPEHLFEVIVVDNGSTDQTSQIITRYMSEFKNFKSIYEQAPGLHNGRNRGFQSAQGDVLVYADDDIEALPQWLETILNVFDPDPMIGLLGGNNLPIYEGDPPSWVNELWSNCPFGKMNGFYSLIDFGQMEGEVLSRYVWGCNFSIRKTIVERLGGFNPDGMPKNLLFYRGDGESDVARRLTKLGYKTYFHSDASVYHHVALSKMQISYIYQRSYAQGISDSYSAIRQRGNVLYSNLLAAKVKMLEAIHLSEKQNSEWKHHSVVGYQRGFFEHHYEVYNSKQLLDWILREDYLGINGMI
ncbi:MAG: glycosyltransferase family 2 protein [Paenibacillus sp.]|uniref:glycosyltransferase family 2 protein n=1 Tax=Paenibacillus sp. TaxID=58172 RepID=UPI0029060730|nr:glycosyltransferase family 2 protein [Paenibacillus sp.]MDU4695592.1 glycosyltransferase family 2 protein [Paenibacillus sp.]